MRLQALATVLGYQALDVFEVDDDDESLDRVEPYITGGHVVVLVDEPDVDEVAKLAAAKAVDDPPTVEQIATAKGDDLRAWLNGYGLQTSGKVDDLRARLVEHLDEA